MFGEIKKYFFIVTAGVPNGQRGTGQRGSGCLRDPAARVHARMCLTELKIVGLLELIVKGRSNGETDLLIGIHQPQVDHERRRDTAKNHIDVITPRGGSLPACLSHEIR